MSILQFKAEPGVPAEMKNYMADLPPYPDVVGLATGPILPYRVGPFDEISVKVFGRPDLGSQTGTDDGRRSSIVAEDGTIHLPFLGRPLVAGMTAHEIAQLVNKGYSKIVSNAQVDVQIVRCGSQPVDLVGAFSTPGRYYVCENLRTIGAVLGVSEGLTPQANPSRGTLTRAGVTYRLNPMDQGENGATRLDVVLRAGDVIHFPIVGDRTVFVFGEVAEPGPYAIPAQGMGLLELLAQAQGWNEQTMSKGIYLFRPANENVVAWKLQLDELLVSPAVPLMDGDRLYVAPTWLARWNWWWRQAIPQFIIPRYSF